MAGGARQFETAEELDTIDEVMVIRPRPMAQPATDIDITPMIDVTFLLLIFFLVAAALAERSAVKLPPARYGDAVAKRQAVVITIASEGARGAAIYKGDGVDRGWRLRSQTLQAQEDELAAYIQAEFDAAPLKRHVLIKAGKDVKHRHVDRVAHAAGRVLDGGRLYLAVIEQE